MQIELTPNQLRKVKKLLGYGFDAIVEDISDQEEKEWRKILELFE